MLLPFERVRFETTKAPAEVREALRASLDDDVGFLSWVICVLPWLAPWKGRHIDGTVTESSFRLISRTRSRPFFLPVTEGVIREEGPKTVLQATLRPKFTEVAAVVVAFLGVMLAALANGRSAWGVVVIGLIIYGAGCLGSLLTCATRYPRRSPAPYRSRPRCSIYRARRASRTCRRREEARGRGPRASGPGASSHLWSARPTRTPCRPGRPALRAA